MAVHWTLDTELTDKDDFARIGYENLARGRPVTASSETNGFPAKAAQLETTFEFWRPTGVPATWDVDLGSAKVVDYFGIAAHNLGAAGASVRAQYSFDNVSWFNASDEVMPDDDGEVLLLFSQTSARYWRLRVEGFIPLIGVIYVGKVLKMERGLYRNHSPLNLSRETEVRPSVSEGGQWLGRSVIRSGLSGDASWRNLTAAWYRANFDLFVQSARLHPFFFAWQPRKFPDEVAYCWTQGDVVPVNGDKRDFMSVSIRMKGAGYV